MKVEITPENYKTVSTDDRGRAYLGNEYADQEVDVIIIERENNE